MTQNRKNLRVYCGFAKSGNQVYIYYICQNFGKKSALVSMFLKLFMKNAKKVNMETPIDFFFEKKRVLNGPIEHFTASFSPPYFVSFFRRTQKWENSRSKPVSFGPLQSPPSKQQEKPCFFTAICTPFLLAIAHVLCTIISVVISAASPPKIDQNFGSKSPKKGSFFRPKT